MKLNKDGNNHVNLKPDQRLIESDNLLVLDASEELSFKLQSFCRAHVNHHVNADSVIRRARELSDLCSDYRELLQQIINAYEAIRSGGDSAA